VHQPPCAHRYGFCAALASPPRRVRDISSQSSTKAPQYGMSTLPGIHAGIAVALAVVEFRGGRGNDPTTRRRRQPNEGGSADCTSAAKRGLHPLSVRRAPRSRVKVTKHPLDLKQGGISLPRLSHIRLAGPPSAGSSSPGFWCTKLLASSLFGSSLARPDSGVCRRRPGLGVHHRRRRRRSGAAVLELGDFSRNKAKSVAA